MREDKFMVGDRVRILGTPDYGEVTGIDRSSSRLYEVSIGNADGYCWYGESALELVEDDERGDPVERPSHYTWHPSGVECHEISGAFSSFCGQAIQYIWRHQHKGTPIEDLRKAIHFLELEAERLERRLT